ncbi:MAG TPA: TA system VapC family ribonuclease toxin [Thermoanaerobaculia bacterium]|nr:TA system VapC family ribonuclease toxin [Thermoanaerobaculia bacterium]
MIVVDANLLIYAYNVDASQHQRAAAWLERVLSNEEIVGMPWAVIHAFLRLTTGGVVFPSSVRMEQSLATVEEWLALPNVKLVEPGERYWQILRRLCTDASVRGNLVSDAHLAAIAIEQDATMYTTDKDFARFPVRVVNPLV